MDQRKNGPKEKRTGLFFIIRYDIITAIKGRIKQLLFCENIMDELGGWSV